MRRILGAFGALSASVALAACGANDDSSSSGDYTKAATSAPVSLEIPKSGCGAVATPLPRDPDEVIAKLPAKDKAQYAGYKTPVSKGVWSDFNPDHGPPYKVGLSFAQLTGSTQVGLYGSIKKNLEANPEIDFTGVTTGTQLNIPQQIQQFNSLLDQKPDVLIVQPLTDAFGPSVEKAAKQGIPTISIQGYTDSKSAINIQSNNYGAGAQAASYVFRKMGGKGNVLYVHGIASSTVDVDAYESYQAAMKNCPGIKQAGEVAGAFVPATAKAEVLKFLATHPEPIDAVIQTGGMTPGIFDAFEQAGRPIPLIHDGAAMKGSMGHWINNEDYNGYGSGYPTVSYGKSVASFIQRMLAGRGLQTSDVVNFYPPINDDNLDQWAETSWNLKTPGNSEGPPNTFMTEEFMSSLFRDSAPAN
jgi:ribose transport system substrate-binding protein